MFFSNLFLTILMALGVQSPATEIKAPTLTCPIMLSSSPATGPKVDYNGMRYIFCCAGCDDMFIKDPQKALKNEKLKGKLVGYSLFDPVSGARLEVKDSKGHSDFNGYRYYFQSAANKAAFDKEPKKYTVAPTKEVLMCGVGGHEVDSYEGSGGYVDHNGVRYYVCCPSCHPKMKAEPAKYAAKVEKHIQAPKGQPVK
jgi:YHS domain-containing protein